mgnify:CR=1 FL=1
MSTPLLILPAIRVPKREMIFPATGQMKLSEESGKGEATEAVVGNETASGEGSEWRAGMTSRCPISIREVSEIRLERASSSTVTPYRRAMDQTVSLRATV